MISLVTMNIPRQPFLGLALMAALGIGVAGFFPIAASQWWLRAIIFAVLAIPLLCWPNLTSTYLLVGCGFFLLHNFRIGDTAGSKGRRFCLCPIAVARLKNHCSHRGLICAAMFWSKASIIREIPARTVFSTQSGRG